MSRAHQSPDQKASGDRVFTPDWAARDMVSHFAPTGRVLEPCRGDGAIYRHLPDGSEWCEIDEGRDFFSFDGRVDWVISNPPYSQTRPFMSKAFSIARNVVFLVPARNIFSGYGTVRLCAGWGALKEIRFYGTGAKLGFPMGNAIAAFHWQEGWTGDTAISFHEDEARSSAPEAREDAPSLAEALMKAFEEVHDGGLLYVARLADNGRMVLDGDFDLNDIAARVAAAVRPQPALTVWYGSMPESNGRENWTAILGRKDAPDFDLHIDGFCFHRSEYPDRARYEADEMRWIIGELAERPDILAYDETKHSGYAAPKALSVQVRAIHDHAKRTI